MRSNFRQVILILWVFLFNKPLLTAFPGDPLDFPGDIHAMVYSQNHLYLARGKDGLAILDVHAPFSPVLISTIGLPGETLDAAVQNDIAFSANAWDGLRVIDISNPANPSEIAFFSAGYIERVIVSTNRIYTYDWDYLLVIDVSQPNAPVLAGERRVCQGASSFDGTYALSVSDDLVLLKAKSHGMSEHFMLALYDASNPQSIENIFCSEEFGYPIHLKAKTAYLSFSYSRTEIWDLKAPYYSPYVTKLRPPFTTIGYYDDLMLLYSREMNEVIAYLNTDPLRPIRIGALRFPEKSLEFVSTATIGWAADEGESGFSIHAYDLRSTLFAKFIPASAHVDGAGGTHWATDATIFNPGQSAADLTLVYTARGNEGHANEQRITLTLPAGQSYFVKDILHELFGLSNTAGSIRIESDHGIFASSRTYNDQGESGSYGQLIPGYTMDECIYRPVNFAPSFWHIIGIRATGDYRTNLGFNEISGRAATVLVDFYDACDKAIGHAVVELQPHASIQYSLQELGVPSVELARARITVEGDGMVLAYASLIDNRTGDGVFLPAQPESSIWNETVQFVPIVAHTAGGWDTQWISDVELFNPFEDQSATLTLLAPEGSYSVSLIIAAGNLVVIEDVVSAFAPEATGSGKGILRVRSQRGLLINSKTYNVGAQGTYGQSMPAINTDDCFSMGEVGHLFGMECDGRFRCNLGFSECKGKPTSILVKLFDQGGNLLAEHQYVVEAGQNLQINGIFADMGIIKPVEAARAEIIVLDGGAVYPYASIVDNRTGDGIFIAATRH